MNATAPTTILPEKSEMTLAPDANGSTSMLPESAPVILKLNIQGIIGLNSLTADQFRTLLYDSRDSIGQNRIQAIFLSIDTPGGSAIDSEGIYQALMEYKQKYHTPIFAFVEGLCASGGMYVACAADKIYATSGSIIGSVGVILGRSFFNFYDLMTTLGIKSLTISQGKDKDMLNPYRPWKEGEDCSLINLTKESYDQFVTIVANSRPNMDKNKLVDVYGAQVYLAPTAQELGYIDVANSSYSQAMQDLVSAASIGTKNYQVIELSRPRSLVSFLTQNSFDLLSGKMRHEMELGPAAKSEFHGKLLYLYQP
jgi:protease-4